VNISYGPSEKNEEFDNLIEKARKNEIVIFSSTMPTRTNPPFALRSATTIVNKDINDINNVIIGYWMNDYLKENKITQEGLIRDRKLKDQENEHITVYIPSVSRFVASIEDKHGYIFEKGAD
jgi:hypothetical protein